MKKLHKWSLGIIVFCVLLIIFISILPKSEKKKVAKQQESAQEIKLNYGEHAIITHQQIIDTIKEYVTEELKSEDYDCKLKKIEIKDKKISVYLDLQFRPQSKSWIVKEGKSWLSYVACQGLNDSNGNFIGNVYSTGYDISVSMWTWLDADEVIPWGHAIIFNSGKPFTERSVELEGRWQDGQGMEMLK